MEGKMSKSYLDTMIGKEVKAFQGGPESANGSLLDVGSDYIILSNEKDGVIYYQTQHIKSIVENSQTNMLVSITDSDNEIVNADSFREVLADLINNTVRINRGGPESRTGTLIAVTEDYLVLSNKKDGVIYYNLDHIKSVSLKANKGKNKNKNDGGEDTASNTGTEGENAEEQDFIEEDRLDHLFKKMKFTLVTINRGGPESVEGVLVDTNNDLLTLVVGVEVVRISKFHVNSISQRINNNVGNTEQSNNENNQNDDSILSEKKKKQDRKKKR